MKRDYKSTFSIGGCIIFALFVAIVSTIVLIEYLTITAITDNKAISTITTLITISIIAVVCAFIDYVRRKHNIENPINDILSATQRLSCGDFDVCLELRHSYGRYDEFDVIMSNLNEMATAFKNNANISNSFIANVSHEIRTPIAVICSCVDALSDNALSLEQRDEYLEMLQSTTQKLSTLVINILKLNKIENCQININKELFNVGELVRGVLITYVETIENKNLSLSCDIDDIDIYSDASLIEIIATNLLSNAIKFTDEGGSISVCVKAQEQYVVLSVTDTGCGISSEVGERIFEKFYQADTSRKTQGNGLGLALVKLIIDVLGGQITVNSQIDKGSTFTVRLQK